MCFPVGLIVLSTTFATWLASKMHLSRKHQLTYGSVLTFGVTYVCYSLNHCQRKTLSLVKSDMVATWTSTNATQLLRPEQIWQHPVSRAGGDPLLRDEHSAENYLGMLDAVFMFAYAIGLYVSGWLSDRNDPRVLLSISMFGSGLSLILFGCVSEWTQVYSVYYYTVFYVLFGLFQSLALTNCICIMANWTSPNRRGLLLGMWSTSQSFGNILGAALVAAVLSTGYQNAFLLTSTLIVAGSVVAYHSIVSDPKELDVSAYDDISEADDRTAPSNHPHLERVISRSDSHDRPINFCAALTLPCVLAYSVCVLCLKSVNYSFFFWLPFYMTDALQLPTAEADRLSIMFDVGGMVGTVLVGALTDYFGVRSPFLFLLLVCSMPFLWLYPLLSQVGTALNVIVMLQLGFCIGGAYNLIITTIAADLGRQPALNGNMKAVGIVTGIIDGTGSLGSGVGQLIISPINHTFGWGAVFVMFFVLTAVSALCLVKMVVLDSRVLLHMCRRNTEEERPLLQ